MSYQRSGDSRLINFDVDVFRQALDAAVGDVEKSVQQAIYSTMSKTRRHARTLLSSLVREKWNIRKGDLDDRIRIYAGERSRGYESFAMTIKGKSVSLAHFSAVQWTGNIKQTVKLGERKKRASKAQGVTVEVIRGQKITLSRAWFQVVPGWGVAIRRRKGKDREPAVIKAVISPASFLNDAQLADRFEEGIVAFIERTFDHEVRWRLQQRGLA